MTLQERIERGPELDVEPEIEVRAEEPEPAVVDRRPEWVRRMDATREELGGRLIATKVLPGA